MNKTIKISIITLGLFLVGGFALAGVSVKKVKSPVICTMDAMMCEDGTYVGRSGPNCEFVCPSDERSKEETKENDDKNNNNRDGVDEESGESENSKGGEGENENDEAKNSKNDNIEPENNIEKNIAAYACTKEYKPVCGEINTENLCISEPCPQSVEKTFSNKCLAEIDGAKNIKDGVCEEINKIKWYSEILDKEDGAIEDNKQNNLTEDKNLDLDNKSSELNKGERGEYRVVYLGHTILISTVQKIANATNEQERKEILNKIFTSNEENEEKVSLKVEQNSEKQDENIAKIEKRKKSIETKSEEIFTKFDYFSNKLNSILDKIESSSKLLVSFEKKEKHFEAKEFLKKSEERKASAWLMFNSLTAVNDKAEAKVILAEVKSLLLESKDYMKKSFSSLKEIVNSLEKDS